jgi:hypothetical protein
MKNKIILSVLLVAFLLSCPSVNAGTPFDQPPAGPNKPFGIRFLWKDSTMVIKQMTRKLKIQSSKT